MSELQIFNIPTFKGFTPSIAEENKVEAPVQSLLKLLARRGTNCYHERFEGDDQVKVFGDLDHFYGDFDDFKRRMVHALTKHTSIEITEDDFKYTYRCANVQKNEQSYHWVVPKISMIQNNLKELMTKIKEEEFQDILAQETRDGEKQFDTSVYSKGRWFRLPNQLKEGVRGTEHEIVHGSLRDFLIKDVAESQLFTYYPPMPVVAVVPRHVQQEVPENIFSDDLALQATQIKIQEYLQRIPADVGQEEWISVAYSIYNLLHQDYEESFALFNEWSKSGAKYEGEQDIRMRFNSIQRNSRNVGGHKFKMRNLQNLANKYSPIPMPTRQQESLVPVVEGGEDSYEAVKRMFEENNFKVNAQTLYCEIQQDTGELIFREKGKLMDRFQEMTHTVCTQDGSQMKRIVRPFIKDWLRDSSKRVYQKIDFIPSGEVPEGVYNTFKGLAGDALLEKYPEITLSDEDADFNAMIEHIKDVCGRDDKMFQYFIGYIAYIIQKRVQAGTALVFQSEQGVGKDLLFGFIMKYLIGSRYCAIPLDADQVLGRFSGLLENKLMVLMNEVSGKATFASNDRIKALIASQNKVTIERKGIDPYEVSNNMSFIFLTNNDNPVKIEKSDRRFVVFRSSDRWINPTTVTPEEKFTHFSELWNMGDILPDRSNASRVERLATRFYLFFKTYDISTFNPINRALSDAYHEMQTQQLHPIHYFFQKIREDMLMKRERGDDDWNMFKKTGTQMLDSFRAWKTDAGFSGFDMNHIQFGGELKKHEFVQKKAIHGIRYICFSYEDVTKHLQSKSIRILTEEDSNIDSDDELAL